MKKSLLIFWLSAFVSTLCLADEIRVAVAANFAAPMDEIAREFTKRTGHDVSLSSGASGKFYAQIKNGAPFQILLSADQEKPSALEAEGLAVQGTRYTYAIGKLALWSTNPNLVDTKGKVLESPRFNKLALANPKVAPYGEAALETLNALGLKSRLEPKFVMGENIGQTYQFVDSGNADLGFVALSQITRDNKLIKGSMWQVPDKLYTPIRQDAVLLVNGKDSAAARQLLAFLKSEAAIRIIKTYGYGVN